jgi:uncharacterized protein YuzE
VTADEGVLHVRLLESEPVRSLEVSCVVDATDFGEVVGIEILDVSRQLAGGIVDPVMLQGGIRWSYDDEVDALYVHIADGRGQAQRTTAVGARLDSTGRLVQLDVPLP